MLHCINNPNDCDRGCDLVHQHLRRDTGHRTRIDTASTIRRCRMVVGCHPLFVDRNRRACERDASEALMLVALAETTWPDVGMAVVTGIGFILFVWIVTRI